MIQFNLTTPKMKICIELNLKKMMMKKIHLYTNRTYSLNILRYAFKRKTQGPKPQKDLDKKPKVRKQKTTTHIVFIYFLAGAALKVRTGKNQW